MKQPETKEPQGSFTEMSVLQSLFSPVKWKHSSFSQMKHTSYFNKSKTKFPFVFFSLSSFKCLAFLWQKKFKCIWIDGLSLIQKNYTLDLLKKIVYFLICGTFALSHYWDLVYGTEVVFFLMKQSLTSKVEVLKTWMLSLCCISSKVGQTHFFF